MGAIIKNMNVAYKDNKAPITISVRYSDNGHSDTLVKTLDTKAEAVKWLGYWYGDTSGGFEHLEATKQVINNLSEK